MYAPFASVAASAVAALLCAACQEAGAGAQGPAAAGPAGSLVGPDERGLSPSRARHYALPLNNPSYVPAALAPGFLGREDQIVGIVVDGAARAYPWSVMRNYHVVNDTLMVDPERLDAVRADAFWGPHVQQLEPGAAKEAAYIPLLVTLCEVCSGASAYVPRVASQPADPLVFAQCRSEGSPAGHYNAIGTFTICDMQTHSRWHPFRGRAGSGPLAGQTLTRIPVAVEPWGDWLERHPDSVVITAGAEIQQRPHARLPHGFMGSEGTHASYVAWRTRNRGQEDTRLATNRLVMGVALPAGSPARAYTLDCLDRQGGLVQDRLGAMDYAIFKAGEHRATAFQPSLQGRPLRLELRSTRPFRAADERGNTWNEIGEAVAGPDRGATLRLVEDSYLAEWADWISEHRGSELVQ